MNETTLVQFAGWSALINAIASVASTITLVLMFTVAGFFGPINDAISIVWLLAFFPLALLFYRLHQPVNAPLSLLAALLGVAAMLVFAVAQTMLVLRIISFERSIGLALSMGAAIGLWALLNGLLARSGGTLPAAMIWLLIIFGTSFFFTAIGWYQAGQEHPLVMTGFLIGAVTGPFWAFWLGRMLLIAQSGLAITE